MGFSSQGKSVHEALLARQDGEIRLIEIMRKCLQQKSKTDREYAAALSSVAQLGLKIDRTDELTGSQIFQAWKKFMEEIEQQSKLIRSNAEHLEILCSDRMAQMCQDKRKLRKQYQEEHTKIASPFTQLVEDVARKKAEYQKHLEYYKQLRMRFEEHYIKSGRAGRKLDDVREKYQKACRKLHLAHNEYVLLIHEATEVEKDYRTIQLPNLLEHHQIQQEHFISTWKNLLTETASHGDFTTNDHTNIQRRIDGALKSIQPADEYKDFTEKYKSLPVIFRFDDNPIDDNVGKLQPNQLTVDNLTVEWLRQRIVELEHSVKDCQEKQMKVDLSNGRISSSASSLPTTPTTPNNVILNNSQPLNGSNGSLKDNKFNKDLCSLKCQERQMNKLIDVIRTALNEVACEELPSGCDDLSVEIDNNNLGNHEPMTNTKHMSVFLQKGGDFMTTLIKTPFKKKRVTIAGGDEAKTAQKSASQTPQSARGGSKARSVSIASSSVTSCCDDEDECAYVVPTNANIYVDIDDGDDEQRIHVAQVPPELPQANSIPLRVSTINECEQLFEQCNEINCSKNNLLLIDDHMMTSIDDHLNNIELINKNLVKLMATQDLIERESLDETTSADVRAEKKKLKEKIGEKIKMLREARGSSSKGSFSSRFKNILRQNSQEEASGGGAKKKFLSSFRKKASMDESEEVFEEISKENPQLVTDLDEIKSEGKISKKFTQKFLKSTKTLLNTKMGKKSNVEIKVCRRCSKQFNVDQGIHHSPASADLRQEFSFDDFCSCNQNLNQDFNESDDDGIVIKNFEYKDVSLHAEFKFSLHYSACSTAEHFHFQK